MAVLDLPTLFQKVQQEHDANIAAGKYKKARNCVSRMKSESERKLVKKAKHYQKTPPEVRHLIRKL
jgi:hypothetical protein